MLTPSESRIAELILSGTTDRRTLANRMSTSPDAVSVHIRRIAEKLHVQPQDVARALRDEQRTAERTIAEARRNPREWWHV
jgi:DNA-binding CsgD family transcriptional regulator